MRKIFCSHEYVFNRNIYGDEINSTGRKIKRSVWNCEKCGKIKLERKLSKEEC